MDAHILMLFVPWNDFSVGRLYLEKDLKEKKKKKEKDMSKVKMKTLYSKITECSQLLFWLKKKNQEYFIDF